MSFISLLKLINKRMGLIKDQDFVVHTKQRMVLEDRVELSENTIRLIIKCFICLLS